MKATTLIALFIVLLLIVCWLLKDMYTERGAPIIGDQTIDMRKMV